jgi:hypothetical protein
VPSDVGGIGQCCWWVATNKVTLPPHSGTTPAEAGVQLGEVANERRRSVIATFPPGPRPSPGWCCLPRKASALAQVIAVRCVQIAVEFVDDRLAGRDLEAGDLAVGDVGEVLHKRAERVAVGGDQDALAVLECGGDALVPIGEDARDRVLEALGPGDRNAVVAPVLGQVEFATVVEHGRRDVEAAAPDMDLRVAVLGRGLRLVETR